MADHTPARPFDILTPVVWSAPVVFNSPHSGRWYGEDFLRLTRLSPTALRKSEDCYVDELFMGCLEHGAPMLRAHAPRSYVDLNREPYELDPRMFQGELPGYVNTTSPRVAGGLGTIPRIVAEGEEIYRGRLGFAEALSRINRIYLPYHRTLAALVDEVQKNNGAMLLVDCHSMPSSALASFAPAAFGPVDIVLGDRFGVSCDEDVTCMVEKHLVAQGLTVLRNKPYAGGFITHTHGAPAHGRHALQIEINRALYLNETTLEKTPEFPPLQKALTAMIAGLLPEIEARFVPRRLAAE
ncbi:MAG: N-formylglutamate amidohydrolase [Rhizobiales bacterium]|nr:N-formylglutamate amidohydrolase [Hyphomicrobiales bacterium]